MDLFIISTTEIEQDKWFAWGAAGAKNESPPIETGLQAKGQHVPIYIAGRTAIQ